MYCNWCLNEKKNNNFTTGTNNIKKSTLKEHSLFYLYKLLIYF